MLPVDQLLEVCNEVRRCGGAEALNALLPGNSQEPDSCLIARNLNFDCEVNTFWLGEYKYNELNIDGEIKKKYEWSMKIWDEDVAIKISQHMNWEIVDDGDSLHDSHTYLRLPAELGDSAQAFDNNDYPIQLYMYPPEEHPDAQLHEEYDNYV